MNSYSTKAQELSELTNKLVEFEMNKLLNELLISKRDNKLINSPSSNEIAIYITKYLKDNEIS